MTTTTKKETTKDKTPAGEKAENGTERHDVEVLDPVTPAEIEEQHRAAREYEKGLIARFQNAHPDKWKLLMANRLEMLERARKACIALTVPEDWTLFQGPGGDVVGVPRKSGCIRMRKIMGITPINYRPKNASGDAEPEISFEEVKKDEKTIQVTVVTMIADGYCHYTGETLEDVRHSVRSDESFIGRGTVQDLTQSCRTGLDSKITRILSDTVKVPEDVLQAHGVKTERAYKGHGYGTSKGREGQRVAEKGVPVNAKALGEEILKRTNGDKEAAKKVLVDITKKPNEDPKKDFKGFDSVSRFTKQWQLDNAWELLKKHPMFGEEKAGAK